MKNVRIRVWESCTGNYFSYGIYENRKHLMDTAPRKDDGSRLWVKKSAAIRNAKAMANRIGIPYDPEIIKEHGC